MVISTEDFQVGGTSIRKRDLFIVNLQRFIHSQRTKYQRKNAPEMNGSFNVTESAVTNLENIMIFDDQHLFRRV